MCYITLVASRFDEEEAGHLGKPCSSTGRHVIQCDASAAKQTEQPGWAIDIIHDKQAWMLFDRAYLARLSEHACMPAKALLHAHARWFCLNGI
jgi:hypothetical protein